MGSPCWQTPGDQSVLEISAIHYALSCATVCVCMCVCVWGGAGGVKLTTEVLGVFEIISTVMYIDLDIFIHNIKRRLFIVKCMFQDTFTKK